MQQRAPLVLPLGLVLAGGLWLGARNAHDAAVLAPQWGQDLAFFTQIVHSAASGGPWASELLLEPQGFFAMVHTHLVLPLVVAAYALWPDQRVLLYAQGLFTALALWPAFRLAETVAHERGQRLPVLAAAVAALSLLVLSPFQAVGTADFRPSALFLPGIVGVFAAARRDRLGQALLWSLVAQAGREEASYLLLPAGLALCVLPWGPLPSTGPFLARIRAALRWRTGLTVAVAAVVAYGLWVVVKPEMFFHFDPRKLGGELSLPPDAVEARLTHLGRAARSGVLLGLLAPQSLIAGLPLFAQLARESREWTLLSGPGAHYHVSWLAFAAPSMLVGAMKLPRRIGGGLTGAVALVVLSALAWPRIPVPEGRPEVLPLVAAVGPEEAVAADHDTVAALAGRPVLWNLQNLHQPDDARPYGWQGPWPLTFDLVDVAVMDADHPLRDQAAAAGLVEVQQAGGKVLLRRP
ncbi:MAG: DUF2079 domain-containing protein [Alphaproteobacteria bacterium]|nr:DUF2079 domain-containing protein [Alphaproteobacteria bacterium]